MSTSWILPRRFGPRDGLILALLCAGAYAGNYLALPLFSGVDLLFGGIVVMFAVLRRSLAEALLVALVGSLHTVVIWGHPYALILFVAEAAFVHILLSRYPREIMLYDALFWLVLGVPVVLVFYGVAMGMDPWGIALIALKQPVNGIFNAAIASLIHHLLLLRGHGEAVHEQRRARLAELGAPLLLMFAMVPTLLIVSLETQLLQRYQLEQVDERLESVGKYLKHPDTAPAPSPAAVQRMYEGAISIGFDPFMLAVVDGSGEPVVQAPSSWLAGRTAVRPATDRTVQRYDPAIGAVMKQARDSYYTREVTTMSRRGGGDHTLVVGIPAAAYVDRLRGMQLAGLALACVVGAIGVAGAAVVAGRSARLLHPLMVQLQRLPAAVRAGEPLVWPRYPVFELAELADGARAMETELTTQIRNLAESEARYRAITANLPGGVFRRVLDPDGTLRFTYLSPNYEHVFGIDVQQALEDSRTMLDVVHPDDRPAYRVALERSARELAPLDVTFRIRLPDGGIRWVRSIGQPRAGDDGSVVWDGIAIDETGRKEVEGELEYLARHDSLTGLYNRDEILRLLADQLGRTSELAVLYVDLDGLKAINDSLGHATGDRVIREAATRIRGAVRDGDPVGRFGGDEFVIVATGIRDAAGAATLAERVLAGMEPPVDLSGQRVGLAASIGILLQPEPGDDPSECLRRADVALYAAKHEARGGWYFYATDMDDERDRRTTLVRDLRTALREDQLYLEYQPKIALASGRVDGVEALVRWRHPEEGVIPPAWFVPLAEQSGLIDALGDQVLVRACADLAAWQARFPEEAPRHVSVNVSGRQLATDALWDSVWRALGESGLPPEALELEVTESVFYDARADVLERLSAAGVSLTIDDYGKGYSTLFVLRDSPTRVVKIDRSFVGRALTSAADRAIIESTIGLAHALGKTVVAEGVETAEQLEVLRGMACDMAQGFYLARPMPAADVPATCRRRW